MTDEIVRCIGEGRDLPAPSGINTLDAPIQAAIVLAIFVAIGVGSSALYGGFDVVRDSFLWKLSRPTWPILGLIYLAAGVAHFTELEGFTNITPPDGTWGFWKTPFSPKVNVLWTGVVEIFGGAWMLFGAGAALAGVTLPVALGPVRLGRRAYTLAPHVGRHAGQRVRFDPRRQLSARPRDASEGARDPARLPVGAARDAVGDGAADHHRRAE